jgi:hypothetical protein
VGGLVLTACTGPAGQSSSPSLTAPQETTQTSTAPTSATPELPTPRVGDCYQLSFDDLALSSNTAPAVDCSGTHTSVTVAVLKNRDPTQVDSIAAACTKAVRRHLGATDLQLATTMARGVWFLPRSAGRTWVSCELVLYASADSLAPLPKKTKNLYKRNSSSIGICGTAAPGTAKFQRVLCAKNTPWHVLVALPVKATTYPGVKTLRTQADFRCSDAIRLAENLPLTYTYGYEWPTKHQWKSGNHHLLCWTKD